MNPGLGLDSCRPVTIRRTPATSITIGNDNASAASAEVVAFSSDDRRSKPAQSKPQTTRIGESTTTGAGDQRPGGFGNSRAIERPGPKWYRPRNRASDQNARKFASVTTSTPRTSTAQWWYERAWTT